MPGIDNGRLRNLQVTKFPGGEQGSLETSGLPKQKKSIPHIPVFPNRPENL